MANSPPWPTRLHGQLASMANFPSPRTYLHSQSCPAGRVVVVSPLLASPQSPNPSRFHPLGHYILYFIATLGSLYGTVQTQSLKSQIRVLSAGTGTTTLRYSTKRTT
ncbi:hypothetical protein EX30DRAFT_352513 [Ascodesmis nigricans]|uniref:Uncharacterized protein n=1 Tax=Ascodesmis nigricans TaxID=341454 RepID=A0A4S2MI85_9PEZI|nr:hypothetical protein EX30DRAFT_352513 [Ascodesmis nigricans]